MALIATLDTASVTESQLGFKTDLLNSTITRRMSKTFYSDLDPDDLVLPLENLKQYDMLYNFENDTLWSYRPKRVNNKRIYSTNIDLTTSSANPSYVLVSPSTFDEIVGTGTTFNFKTVGDAAIVAFKDVDLTWINGTFQPSYFELEFTDTSDPDGYEQNRQFLSNIIVSVSNDGVDYTLVNDLLSLQNRPFIDILVESGQYNSQNINYLKFECNTTLPTAVQDKTFIIKNLKYVSYPLTNDWVRLSEPKFYRTYKFTNSTVIPYPGNNLITFPPTSETITLPYTGYYNVSIFAIVYDFSDPGGAIRIVTTSAHKLDLYDLAETNYMTIDSGPYDTGTLRTPTFYNGSVQGSRIVKLEAKTYSRDLFRIYTNQTGAGYCKYENTYVSIEYLGEKSF